MSTVMTIFVASYDDQAPALFFYRHAEGLDAAAALDAAYVDYARAHPEEAFFGTDVFSDIPADWFARYGLTEDDGPHIQVLDFDTGRDYSFLEGDEEEYDDEDDGDAAEA